MKHPHWREFYHANYCLEFFLAVMTFVFLEVSPHQAYNSDSTPTFDGAKK
jgi:hypothetical protein